MDKYSRDAETWRQWADATYAGARTLFHSENFQLWFPAAILGHQALEMYLKAALIRRGHAVAPEDIWGHDLSALAEKLAAKDSRVPPTIGGQLQVFTDYFNELRYPCELVNVSGLGESEGQLLDERAGTLRPYAEP